MPVSVPWDLCALGPSGRSVNAACPKGSQDTSVLGGRWACASPAPRGGRAPCMHVWEQRGREGAVGACGPPGWAWQALSESHDGHHRARGFPGSPAGPLAEDPPEGGDSLPVGGTRSSWPVAAASLPRAGHELFFHFYTGTDRNDKTLSDEGRTGTDKPWKILFPQITGGVSTRSPGRKAGGGSGAAGRGSAGEVPLPVCWDVGTLPCPRG